MYIHEQITAFSIGVSKLMSTNIEFRPVTGPRLRPPPVRPPPRSEWVITPTHSTTYKNKTKATIHSSQQHHIHRSWTSHTYKINVQPKPLVPIPCTSLTGTHHSKWYPPVRALLYPVLTDYTEPSMAQTVLRSQHPTANGPQWSISASWIQSLYGIQSNPSWRLGTLDQ